MGVGLHPLESGLILCSFFFVMTASVSLRSENFKETSFAMVSRNVCFLMCVLKCSFVGQVASKVSGGSA